MDDMKLGLMSAILNFLREQFRAGYLDPENNEGLEVAIHCLENIYDVSRVQQTPDLMEIFRAYMTTSVFSSRNSTEEEKAEGERLKVEGNIAMSNGKYTEALDLYSRAIDCNPKNAVYYCNRAAAKSKLGDHNSAIDDCKIALQLDPKYSKAYGRLGLAYCGLDNYVNAYENYKKAYELESDNEGYRRNYELAQQKLAEIQGWSQELPRHCPQHPDAPVGPQPPRAQPTAQPSNAQAGAASNAPGGSIPLCANTELINIASQMLADPAMHNMMSNMMQQDYGHNIDALIHAGQTLARQLENDSPDLFNQLRLLFNLSGENPNSRPDSSQGGQGPPSRDKQQ